MYSSKILKSLATRPMIQLQTPVPDWMPLNQEETNRWCTLPEAYDQDFAKRIHNFETRESDVFVVTFMKCGTTWMQELAWLLLNNLDFERARSSFLLRRSPHIEHSAIDNKVTVDNISLCDNLKDDPRLIKTHLPAQLLPKQIWLKKRKIIYVARNPKDVLVSSYHFLTGIGLWEGSLEEFTNQFIEDRIIFTSYWSHVLDFYRMRHEPNVFFVTYEEMKNDLKSVVSKLSTFLECRELNENEMEKLLQHLSFANMKENETCNPTELIKKVFKVQNDFQFMRKGVIGTHKDELTPEQIKKVDSWSLKYLRKLGLIENDIFDN